MERNITVIAGEMRLVAEGARSLFESELSSLYGFLMKNGKEEEALALDTIGTALATLEQQAHDLQRAYAAEFKVEK